MSGKGCGGGCHCGGGGNCSNCPKRGGCGGCGGCGGGCCGGCCGPLSVLMFNREDLVELLKAVQEAPASVTPDKKNIILRSEESGLVLHVGVCDKTANCQSVDCEHVDPLVGWAVADAKLTPSVDLVPVGLFAIISPTVIEIGMHKSLDKVHVFFLLFRGQMDGCIGQFSLRPMEYTRLNDEDYAAKCEPAVWPPKETPPPSFVSAFIPDNIAYTCEAIRNERHETKGEPLDKFLYAGKKPEVGMFVYLHVVLDHEKCPEKPFTRLFGVITEVEPLPPEDAPVDKLIGESYYKHCKCGKPHPREELIQQLGTIHGAKVHAVVYVAPDQMGDCIPEWVGQWNVILVANDALQALWHLYGMGPRPRDQWIERISRTF